MAASTSCAGFGGSVAALRLAEKGYRVTILEAGRRFADEDFAETSWDLKNFLWAPKAGCYGIQRIHALKDVMILAGAGAGGGAGFGPGWTISPSAPAKMAMSATFAPRARMVVKAS